MDEEKKGHWISGRNEKGETTLTLDVEEEAKEKLYEVYEKIIEFNENYMDIPKETSKIISIWVIGTYFHEEFQTYPYLFLNAMRGSGKTRQLKIISNLGNLGDGTIQNDMKEAVLFRMKRNKVLCIDEFENVGAKDKQILRQLLNSAYKKGMKITRMKKVYQKGEEGWKEDEFEPFFPICMANIWGMDEVLGDRSITLFIEKSSNPMITKKVEDFEENYTINYTKQLLKRYSVQLCSVVTPKNIIKAWNLYLNTKYFNDIFNNINITTLNNINTQLDKTLNDNLDFFNAVDEAGIDGRNFELCFPLLLVAKTINKELFLEILDILKKIVKTKKEGEFSDSKDVCLYDFISNRDDLKGSWVSLKQITNDFRIYMGEQDLEDRWLNEKWLGRALNRLQLKLLDKRYARGMMVVLNIDKAKQKIKMFKTIEEENGN